VKRRDLERHLRAHGCQLVDEGARHTKWAGPAGQRSAVPRHREIAPGLAPRPAQSATRHPTTAKPLKLAAERAILAPPATVCGETVTSATVLAGPALPRCGAGADGIVAKASAWSC